MTFEEAGGDVRLQVLESKGDGALTSSPIILKPQTLRLETDLVSVGSLVKKSTSHDREPHSNPQFMNLSHRSLPKTSHPRTQLIRQWLVLLMTFHQIMHNVRSDIGPILHRQPE